MASIKSTFIWIIASSLLAAMLILMFASSRGDTLTFDESAHITAGYSYVRYQDNRLNPEHPPLLKMLSALPLLTLKLNFPLDHKAWKDDVNGQWETAGIFLYESGNNPHKIAQIARIAPILLAVLLGFVLFLFTKNFAGENAAVLALLLYAFSPTVLAHGRFVTTDIAAAFGVTIAGFSFVKFLKEKGVKSVLRAGITLGIALLFKFSTFILIPFFGFLTILWILLEPRKIIAYLFGLIFIVIIAAATLLLPYLWTTNRYPAERQLNDTYYTTFHYAGGPLGRKDEDMEKYFETLKRDRTRDLKTCANLMRQRNFSRLGRCPSELAIYLADKPVVRAWGEYLFGLVMTTSRASGGNTTYFMGEVSARGWRKYFPTVYAIKETLPFHVLTLIALFFALVRVFRSSWGVRSIINWLLNHPAETFMLGFIALYWGLSVNSRLNIGVRHLMPVLPFTMILAAREITRWLGADFSSSLFISIIKQAAKTAGVALLIVWQMAGVLLVYPSFLAYFNEAVGGPNKGADYAVDSNLDWGQDLGRLREFVENRKISKIAIDYFGGGSPRYELGDKYIPWWSARGPYEGWFAVSATLLKGAQGQWDPALEHKPEDSYDWLRGKKPVAKIGFSIYVFDLREKK